jgi:hypothetical protein
MSYQAQPGTQPDRIDLHEAQDTAAWTRKLDVTLEQLQEAVDAVGDVASDVEMHLKGSRSTTNADRVDEVEDADPETRIAG